MAGHAELRIFDGYRQATRFEPVQIMAGNARDLSPWEADLRRKGGAVAKVGSTSPAARFRGENTHGMLVLGIVVRREVEP